MNCLCNLFEDNIWWVLIAILILFLLCNNSGSGCGCSGANTYGTTTYGNCNHCG